MAYQRIPDSLAAALSRIHAELGEDQMAQVVGKTASLIRKWCNPNSDAEPNLRQALLLDAACLKAIGRAPIQEFYSRALGQAEAAQQQRDLQMETLDVFHHAGKVASKVREVLAAESIGGKAITPREAVEVDTEFKDLIEQIEQAREAVRPMLPH